MNQNNLSHYDQLTTEYKNPYQIPTECFEAKALNGNERFVLITLWTFASRDTKTCFPSNAKIAERTALSESTIRRAIDRLIELCFVIKEERRNDSGKQTSNLYTLRDPGVVNKLHTGVSDRQGKNELPTGVSERKGVTQTGTGVSHRQGEGVTQTPELNHLNYPSLTKQEQQQTPTRDNRQSDCNNWIMCYEKNIGADKLWALGPAKIQMINEFIDEGLEEEAICFAIMNYASTATHEFKYLIKVLRGYVERGITTSAQALIAKVEYEQKQEGKKQGRKTGTDARFAEHINQEQIDLPF